MRSLTNCESCDGENISPEQVVLQDSGHSSQPGQGTSGDHGQVLGQTEVHLHEGVAVEVNLIVQHHLPPPAPPPAQLMAPVCHHHSAHPSLKIEMLSVSHYVVALYGS